MIDERQRDELPLTVSQINNLVAELLEGYLPAFWFTAEISSFKRHSSGHCYLRLKDSSAVIPGVIWRSRAANIDPSITEGSMVCGYGKIKVFARGGYYQLDIYSLRPQGIGSLAEEFEKRKQVLTAKGYFAQENKKPLPQSIQTIGVVTAKSSAALQDFVRITARRAPQTTILLADTLVQGDKAPQQIVKAIAQLQQLDSVDAIVVIRGGGSLEDLWAFNETEIVEALYHCPKPVITGIGHEIDFTLADFAADLRAPTPSAAAEMITREQAADMQQVAELRGRLGLLCSERLNRYKKSITRHMVYGLQRAVYTRVENSWQTIDYVKQQISHAARHNLREQWHTISTLQKNLSAHNPNTILNRGYAYVQDSNARVVTSARSLRAGQSITLRFSDSSASATVEKTRSDTTP